MLLAGAAHGDPVSAIHDTIESSSPVYYWTLEDTRESEVPSGANSVLLDIYEQDGGNAQASALGFLNTEYLPMLPDHMTPIEGSPAAIFGELDGNLAGAIRYAEMTDSLSSIALDALGMSGDDDWTLHLIVSPEPTTTQGACAWEPLFVAGNSNNGVRLELNYNPFGGSVYQVRATRIASGVSSITSVTPTAITDANGRAWFEIFVSFKVPSPFSNELPGLTLNANGASDFVITSAPIPANQTGGMRLGAEAGASPSCAFSGAMHHLAIWDRALSANDRGGITDAFDDPATTVSTLYTDWNAPVRYYTWTVPNRVGALPVLESDPSVTVRDMLRWEDDFWDNDGVYPMVRFYAEEASNGWFKSHPRSHGFDGVNLHSSFTVPSNDGPQGLAHATWNWIRYINENLGFYTNKTIADSTGYTIFWQNWGSETEDGYTNHPDTHAGTYIDLHGSRGLMTNWRDTPEGWRHDTGTQLTGGIANWNEINIPFLREGMSQNAYRTRETMTQLNAYLDGFNFPAPTRLHFDVEGRSRTGSAIPCPGGGWWCTALTDDRAGDPAQWADAGALLDGFTYSPNTTQLIWNQTNFRNELSNFVTRQYEWGLYNALVRPAREVLRDDIRASEYGVIRHSGRQLDYLDFGAPALYPMQQHHFAGHGGSPDSIADWATELGFAGLGITVHHDPMNPDADDTIEDLKNIYVERAKQNLNAWYLSGKTGCDVLPQSPWLPYPGSRWNLIRKNGNVEFQVAPPLDDHKAQWQEIARIAVFAYRHGMREFLLWGSDGVVGAYHDLYQSGSNAGEPNFFPFSGPALNNPTQNIEDLEAVLEAVAFAEANLADVTTGGALDRSNDNFGVPDGDLDVTDFVYFIDRFKAGDLEADISGPCGIPDGVLDTYDETAFSNAFYGS